MILVNANVLAHEHKKWRNAMNKPYYESLNGAHTAIAARFFHLNY